MVTTSGTLRTALGGGGSWSSIQSFSSEAPPVQSMVRVQWPVHGLESVELASTRSCRIVFDPDIEIRADGSTLTEPGHLAFP